MKGMVQSGSGHATELPVLLELKLGKREHKHVN